MAAAYRRLLARAVLPLTGTSAAVFVARDAWQEPPTAPSPHASASTMAASWTTESLPKKRSAKGKQRVPDKAPPSQPPQPPPPPIERVIGEFSNSPAIFNSVSAWAKALGAAFTVYGQLHADEEKT